MEAAAVHQKRVQVPLLQLQMDNPTAPRAFEDQAFRSLSVGSGGSRAIARLRRYSTHGSDVRLIIGTFSPVATFEESPMNDADMRFPKKLLTPIAARNRRGIAVVVCRVEPVAELRTLTQPVLFMWGEHDFVSADDVSFYATARPGSEAVTIPDAGHLAFLDNPDATNETIRRFLNRVER